MYRKTGKRVIDVFLSICGLIVCAIPMLIIAILIKMDSKGPVLFKEERLGKDQKIFTIYKVRSMCQGAYEIGGIVKRSDDKRITRVGAFLRRTSLDELPQMFNIIRGDMAIVGPRPILPWEFYDYQNNSRYCRRYDVLPGLFCSIDIDYRASADRNLQFEMDAEYARNITFFNDLKLFSGVIKTVISGKNVYCEEIQKK